MDLRAGHDLETAEDTAEAEIKRRRPAAYDSFRHPDRQFFHVYDAVALRYGLTVGSQRFKVLRDSLSDIALGLLNALAVTEATGNRWTIGKVPFVFRLLLNDDLEGKISHISVPLPM
jgi:hypothetical protein